MAFRQNRLEKKKNAVITRISGSKKNNLLIRSLEGRVGVFPFGQRKKLQPETGWSLQRQTI
jgi:hypothetical protein